MKLVHFVVQIAARVALHVVRIGDWGRAENARLENPISVLLLQLPELDALIQRTGGEVDGEPVPCVGGFLKSSSILYKRFKNLNIMIANGEGFGV